MVPPESEQDDTGWPEAKRLEALAREGAGNARSAKNGSPNGGRSPEAAPRHTP
jgi:hypothetical protein